MRRNKDGSFIFQRDELTNSNNKIELPFYSIDQYQFHLLIKKSDSLLDSIANQALYIAISVVIQLFVIFILVCYYQLTNNKDEIESILLNINDITIGLLLVSFIVGGVLKIFCSYRHSERKELISTINSHFNKE